MSKVIKNIYSQFYPSHSPAAHIVVSGDKATIKIEAGVESLYNSMRPIQPEKGSHNPAHLQTNLPPHINHIVTGRRRQII